MSKITNKKIYVLLFLITIATSGISIAYLTKVAKDSGTANGEAYPAPFTSTARDNVVLTRNMVDHGIFALEEEPPLKPSSWRVPGYPVFAAPFYIIFGSFYPILFAQILILFVTVVLIFKMSKSVLGTKWALGLSVLYLLLPDTILAVSALTTENLFVFILVAALYTLFFSKIENLYLKWALTGFLLALATYVREASFYILIFLIPAYFIFYLKRSEISKRHVMAAVLMVLTFAATLLPWFIRNKNTFGVFAFGSTGAHVLLRQNAAQFYQSISGLNALESRTALLERAGFPAGPVPVDFESAPALKKVALEVITEHPLRYTLFHLSTFIPFFTSSGAQEYWRFVNDMLPDFDPEPEPSFIQAVNPFSWPLLITVIKNHGWTLVENAFWGLIALLVFASYKWSKDVRLSRMFLVIILYFALVTGPIAHARYRIPIEPLLLINAFSVITLAWSRYGKVLLNKKITTQ